MLKNKELMTLLVMTFVITSSAHAAGNEKTAAERSVTEPLEVWGNLRAKNAPDPSTEYLEKMAVDFDKISNPLCAAAAAGNKKELEYLLRDGVSPDSTDSLGISALSHAILGNSKTSFSILISAGANINQQGPFGVTPLMLAANSNLTDMVQLLLLNGASPHTKNNDGETALSIAKRKNLTDVVALLQPPPKIVLDTKPISPLSQPLPPPPAVQEGVPVITKSDEEIKLIQPKNPPETAAKGIPAAPLSASDEKLLQAVKRGLTQTADRLLQEGANPNLLIPPGLSPLIIAVSRNDIATAEILLRHDADVDILAEFDMTPLMIAVQNENPAMIRLLLKNSANPRRENIAGQSACDLGNASADPAIQGLFKNCF